MNVSLRAKGILALIFLAFYIATISAFLAHQRENLVQIVREIESNQTNQALLAPIVSMLAHSIVETQAVLNSPENSASRSFVHGDLADHFDTISIGLKEAQPIYLVLAQDVGTFRQAAELMRALPNSMHLLQVRDSQQHLIGKLHDILAGLQKRSAGLTQQYRDTQQYLNVFSISANVAGAVAGMVVILVFFTRLARDIKRLQDRAVAIVAGYSGPPLPTTRHDEVGGLINAVNRMQADLRHWEQQLEMARQQQSHHEKMAAVGSLAAAIGHEVSNPIAAISGVAQFIVDETKRDDRPSGRMVNDFAAQILKHTERISLIMRRMATLTAPRSPEAELLDLNALIQSTCGFISYDNRFRGIKFEQDLRGDLPAITAVADHITQVLMNLLINAADSMDPNVEAGRRRIRIATSTVPDGVQVSISDNGRGMTPDVLAKAFEESFTTKPAGKGRGIGLFVCRTLVEEAGGSIALASKPEEGTTATLCLPLCPPARKPD